ncbi:Ankyrin repeat-containing domain [Phytophthora cactorum]|nr:Ankyrin repeat-containing domain [Phytophthora cactorum]
MVKWLSDNRLKACVRVVCRHGPDALRLPHVVAALHDFLDWSKEVSLWRACGVNFVFLVRQKLASYAMEPVDSSMRNPHFQQSQFSQGVTTAVRTGNLELIELLSTHFTGCSVPTKALQVAALLGNHDVFQWFVTHREDTEWDDSVPNDCSREWPQRGCEKLSAGQHLQPQRKPGHDQVDLESLGGYQTPASDATCRGFRALGGIGVDHAATSGRRERVFLLFHRSRQGMLERAHCCSGMELAYISSADCDAARVGQLDLVKLLHSNNVDGCSRSAIRSAAAHNNFDIVKWLISCKHKSVLEIGSYFPIDGAACNGHFEMVKWLHEHTPEACSHSAMDGAQPGAILTSFNAHEGNLQIVQWLSENRTEGCTTSAMDNAAYYGHIEVVKWLHDNRREGCTVDAMNLAARNGHLDVVKWLHLNRTEGCTTAAMDCAADSGHLDVVQWLAENRSEGCTTIALDGAVINKHRAVADWLLRNRSEGGTAAIMAAIAARGDIEAVYWCHFVAQVTYDATAADAAVRSGHFAIARFLHEYREWNECDIIRALRECPYSNRRWEFAEWMYWHHRDELESMVEDIFADL